jgi:hypothetical protein
MVEGEDHTLPNVVAKIGHASADVAAIGLNPAFTVPG